MYKKFEFFYFFYILRASNIKSDLTPYRNLFMNLRLLLPFLLFITSITQAQELRVKEKIKNLTDVINDGVIEIEVSGGVSPYTYQWSNQSTALTSNRAENLTEGVTYSVLVTDATGNWVNKEYLVPTTTIAEQFNGAFTPIVNSVSSVLFWDPFAALGLHDPVVYENGLPVLHPNGDPVKKGIPFIVVWLGIGALFFTLRMGFINIRGFRHGLQLAKGKYSDPDAPGQVTRFQALATAVSATVGLGNIAGVAVAVSVGGAGATFWMIVAGFLGMTSKFVECVLGVKYRDITTDGRVFGGPMSYLEKGFAKRNKKKLGKILAVVFAVLCVGGSFGGGNMFQANQSFEAIAGQIPLLEGNGFWFGIIMAIIVATVIIGGIKSIVKVTEKIVPFMAILYVLACLTVIFFNFDNLGMAFRAIFDGAFSPGALKGGVIGVLIIGFQRAAFSNEAGVGSAAIAHSAVKTNYPASEGFVALIEPFLDTIIICTLTALVIIFSGNHEVVGMGGSQLTADSFATVISWFPAVLALAIFLFAFSTMISWSYYGMRAWTYLFGKSKQTETVYKVLFLFFVVLGSSISLGAVLDFSDMMILAMAVPNMIGLYMMSGEVRRDMKDYLKRLKNGELYTKDKS